MRAPTAHPIVQPVSRIGEGIVLVVDNHLIGTYWLSTWGYYFDLDHVLYKRKHLISNFIHGEFSSLLYCTKQDIKKICWKIQVPKAYRTSTNIQRYSFYLKNIIIRMLNNFYFQRNKLPNHALQLFHLSLKTLRRVRTKILTEEYLQLPKFLNPRTTAEHRPKNEAS